MRPFILLLLFLTPFCFSGQTKKEPASIYILRTGVGDKNKLPGSIQIGNQPSFNINAGSVIEFKSFSEGQIMITGQYEGESFSYYCRLKVKSGKKYYICFNSDNLEEENYDVVASFIRERKNKIEVKEETHIAGEQQRSADPQYSSIYIINDESLPDNAFIGEIHIENQSPFNLQAGGIVIYKIYSEGEISVQAHHNNASSSFFATLQVKRGNEYFLYLTKKALYEDSKNNIDVPSLNGNILKERREENLNYPIYPNTIKSYGGGGQGTCFLISSEGFLITNNHCIKNAKEIVIRGIGEDFKTKYAASIVAADPSNDLALLKLNSKNIKLPEPVFSIRTTGISAAEKVYALGYPNAIYMGEEVKITEGIISSLSGSQNDVSKMQISAAINPGNSGGPLIDDEGNLIGVVFAKSKIAESAGYAIKSSYLEAFLKNAPGFNYPALTNSIKDKPLTEKVKELRNFIYIVETD